MDLSGLESAKAIDTKGVRADPFRIVWDHLGWFPPQVVPVLFPPLPISTFAGESCVIQIERLSVHDYDLGNFYR